MTTSRFGKVRLDDGIAADEYGAGVSGAPSLLISIGLGALILPHKPLARLRNFGEGNFGDVKPVGEGVYPGAFAAGLGGVARDRSMSQITRDAGLSRESLYKALSGERNPELGTVLATTWASKPPVGMPLSMM